MRDQKIPHCQLWQVVRTLHCTLCVFTQKTHMVSVPARLNEAYTVINYKWLKKLLRFSIFYSWFRPKVHKERSSRFCLHPEGTLWLVYFLDWILHSGKLWVLRKSPTVFLYFTVDSDPKFSKSVLQGSTFTQRELCTGYAGNESAKIIEKSPPIVRFWFDFHATMAENVKMMKEIVQIIAGGDNQTVLEKLTKEDQVISSKSRSLKTKRAISKNDLAPAPVSALSTTTRMVVGVVRTF